MAGAEDLVEKEARRLEVMKRRQERELAQLVAYEMARKEMQDKAEAKVGACKRWGARARCTPGAQGRSSRRTCT